ncbi:MAG: diaminopropionate ammonia-lyase [Bacillota bacterium]
MDIKYISNPNIKTDSSKQITLNFLSQAKIKKVRQFFNSFKEYKPTPLHSLDSLARETGVRKILVKDESYRFGLNAFKVLGGAYAIGKYLSKKLAVDLAELSFEKLCSKEMRGRIGDLKLVAATDGNHGRGVAWAARRMGQKAVIFMPKGSAQARLESIRDEGAEVAITDYNYDDVVEYAKEYAKKHHGVMIQDTAWNGYEEIPTWIMQGYAVIADEITGQLREEAIEKPTHIFLQAGVGSFAASIQGYYSCKFGGHAPVTVIVEPEKAACIFKSALVNDGLPHSVKGDLDTIMAGLACGAPNTIGWNILRDYANMYVSCPDYVSAYGMRILANPIRTDPRVISGESGAVGLGLFGILAHKAKYRNVLDLLKIDHNSIILGISTEGATDPAGYRKVVWEGCYPLPGD